jgi:hypothetical protein
MTRWTPKNQATALRISDTESTLHPPAAEPGP